MTAPSHFVGSEWLDGGTREFDSRDPATGEVVWSGKEAGSELVNRAIAAAREAAPKWASAPLGERVELLRAYEEQLKSHHEDLARLISRDMGKPFWESKTEVATMIGKVGLSIEAYGERCAPADLELGGGRAAMRFKPHGVVGVLGPFNFPGHLPNGHIVPAVLAGNTVVFKPSRHAPNVGERMVQLWQAAGLPDGVINLVQGSAETGAALAKHPGIDGLFFTGSFEIGRGLSRIFAEHPGRILALELGGNNPLIVHEAEDLNAAAYLTILSAYLTSGQRCTCARRLILVESTASGELIGRLVDWIARLRVGAWDASPEPFMGPLVAPPAADKLMNAQAKLIESGARSIVEMKQNGDCPAMLSPGLIDVTDITDRSDEEWFGPLLQVIRVRNFEEAVREANNTQYGLAASLLSDSRQLFERFYSEIRAGVVNWNRQTTGASGRLPFGGVGNSGNHRPSGFFAADYCSFPVSSVETDHASMPDTLSPGLEP